jgi:flagellar biosynthesis/type III secretory pathway chaperone
MSSHKSTSDLQQFAASVQRTLAALQRLEVALQNEQAALVGTVPEQLEQAVQAKIGMLSELEPLLAERDAIQQRLGVDQGLAGGDQLLTSAPPDAAVRIQWEELKALAARVEKRNTQNGQLALQGEKTARYAVSLLTGRPTEPDVYGKQGSTSNRLGGVTLAKA